LHTSPADNSNNHFREVALGKTANYVIEIPCHIVPWGWWHDGCCQSSEVKKFKASHPEYL
jgi:hypothetical protein